MPMTNNGLTKLIEECGEVIQIAAKAIRYPNTNFHPDDKGPIDKRLEKEIADVIAICFFVALQLKLDNDAIGDRINYKVELFKKNRMRKNNETSSNKFVDNNDFGCYCCSLFN